MSEEIIGRNAGLQAEQGVYLPTCWQAMVQCPWKCHSFVHSGRNQTLSWNNFSFCSTSQLPFQCNSKSWNWRGQGLSGENTGVSYGESASVCPKWEWVSCYLSLPCGQSSPRLHHWFHCASWEGLLFEVSWLANSKGYIYIWKSLNYCWF